MISINLLTLIMNFTNIYAKIYVCFFFFAELSFLKLIGFWQDIGSLMDLLLWFWVVKFSHEMSFLLSGFLVTAFSQQSVKNKTYILESFPLSAFMSLPATNSFLFHHQFESSELDQNEGKILNRKPEKFKNSDIWYSPSI